MPLPHRILLRTNLLSLCGLPLLIACGGSSANDEGSMKGGASSSGSISAGGSDGSTVGNGVTSASGGSPASGGTPATGGAVDTAGTTTGGTPASGGSGGTPATGGAVGTAGTTTGGTPTSEGSGGTPATSGAVGTAGTTTGGTPTSEGSGGTPTTGGAVDTAGTPSTGGGGSAGTGEASEDHWSAGCNAEGPSLAEGPHSIDVEGRSRSYTVRLPQGYDRDKAWPVVLALHPNGGEVDYWDQTSGSRNIRGYLADKAIIIIAQSEDGNWRDWVNDAPKPTPEFLEKELAYFDAVIEEVNGQLCVDKRALFAMGFSGGGSFAGVLACMRTDIRAFAAGGSVIYFDEPACVGSAAAWITLSTEDASGSDGVLRRAYRDFFAERNSCDAADPSTMGCFEYENCDSESPTSYCHYSGAHDWPSDGVENSWNFFSQFLAP